jgi:hypothetical protein
MSMPANVDVFAVAHGEGYVLSAERLRFYLQIARQTLLGNGSLILGSCQHWKCCFRVRRKKNWSSLLHFPMPLRIIVTLQPMTTLIHRYIPISVQYLCVSRMHWSKDAQEERHESSTCTGNAEGVKEED